MDQKLQLQKSIHSSIPSNESRRGVFLEHQLTMRRSSQFTYGEIPEITSLTQRLSKLSTSNNNTLSRNSNQQAQLGLNRESLDRFSLTRSSIISQSSQPKLRTREWDYKKEYESMSQFLVSLLDERDKYEAFINGQQLVHLNNEVDTEIVAYILRKPQKTRFEIDYIKRALKQIDIFSDSIDLFTSKDQENRLFQQFNIEYFTPNTEIFCYNEFGENFYIVLKGRVACLAPNQDLINNQGSPTNKESPLQRQPTRQMQLKRKDSILKFSNSSSVKHDPPHSHKLTISDIYPNMNFIKTYKQGEYFGEISLLTKQKRTASMVAEDDVQLLTITKKGFNLLLGTKQQQILKEKMKFLKQFAFLDILSNARLLSLLHDVKEITYPGNGTIIYKEDDSTDNLYLIKSGLVELSYKQTQNSNYQDAILNLFKTPKSIKYQRVPLIIKGPNTYFGEEDFLLSQNKRTKCAQVISEEAVILVVNFRNLMINLKFFGGQIILSDMFNIKSNWECQRIANIEETKLKCTKKNIFNQLFKNNKRQSEDRNNRSSINFISLSKNEPIDCQLEKVCNSQRDPISSKRNSQFGINEKEHDIISIQILQTDMSTIAKKQSVQTIHKFLSNNGSTNSGFQQYQNEEQSNREEMSSNSSKLQFSSVKKANNLSNQKYTHENIQLSQQQSNNLFNKTIINTNSCNTDIEQEDKIIQHDQTVIQEKSRDYFNQNILSNKKVKKSIPLLNLDSKKLSSHNKYYLTSLDSDQSRLSNIFYPQTPGSNKINTQSITNRGNQSERSALGSQFQNRKLSGDITLRHFHSIKGFQSNNLINNPSLNNFSETTARLGFNENKSNLQTGYMNCFQQESSKLDQQDEIFGLLRSNFVNDARDLVKQKQTFLDILKRRKQIGNIDNFKGDYFKIPKSLIKKCIQQKQVSYREFQQISYFYPKNVDQKKAQQQQQPEQNPKKYEKVVNNLMKFVKNTEDQDKQEPS